MTRPTPSLSRLGALAAGLLLATTPLAWSTPAGARHGARRLGRPGRRDGGSGHRRLRLECSWLKPARC